MHDGRPYISHGKGKKDFVISPLQLSCDVLLRSVTHLNGNPPKSLLVHNDLISGCAGP